MKRRPHPRFHGRRFGDARMLFAQMLGLIHKWFSIQRVSSAMSWNR